MKTILILISTLIFLFSCRSLKESKFVSKEKGNKLLQPLSHSNVVDIIGISANKDKFKIAKKDIEKYIDEEFNKNISSIGDYNGNIDFKIDVTTKLSGLPASIIVAFCTAGINCLIGLPLGTYKSRLDITATIKDSNNKIIWKYNSSGFWKAWIAMYWGYDKNSAFRKSYLKALQSATADLEKQIQQDFLNLNNLLKSTSNNNLSSNNTTINTSQYSTSDVDINIPESSSKNNNAYCLIIGNEDYSSYQTGLGTEVNVQFAENDAKIFKEYCIKTLGIPKKNITLLTNATGNKMLQNIDLLSQLAKASNGNAELIFYYAGHGLPDEQTKEPHLIPVDVNGKDLNYAIKLMDIYKKLTENPSKKITVFIDACFSGGARNESLLALRGVKIKPKENVVGNNLIVFTSSSGEESSAPYKEKQHGMFTYYLLKKMQESKGDFTYSELDEYLKKEISVNSLLINQKQQTPQVIGGIDIGEKWKNWKIK